MIQMNHKITYLFDFNVITSIVVYSKCFPLVIDLDGGAQLCIFLLHFH